VWSQPGSKYCYQSKNGENYRAKPDSITLPNSLPGEKGAHAALSLFSVRNRGSKDFTDKLNQQIDDHEPDRIDNGHARIIG
jgi:hypothetical protein